MNSVRERILREIVARLSSAIAPTPVLRMPAVPVARETSPALLLFADTGVLEHNGRGDRTYRREWTDPYGLMGPPGSFGLLSRRYEAQHGLDYRMLGKLAVTQRNHAIMNENACEKLRVPITIDDYINSRTIADPIRLLDCVMPADGAAGLIMTSRKRAKEKGFAKSVIPIGYAERTNFKGGEELVDVTRSGHEVCGKKALAQAGIGIKDVRSFHPYDDFLIAIVIQFEAFGFCKPGEGIQFVRDHDLSYQGDLPLNTGGGQISAGQPGLALQWWLQQLDHAGTREALLTQHRGR